MSAGLPLYFTVVDKSVFTSYITNPRLSHIFAKQDQVAWLFPVAKHTDTIVVSNDGLSFCTQHAPHDKEELDPIEKKSNTHVQDILTLSGKFVCIRKNFLAALRLIKSYQCSSSVQNLLLRIYGSSSSVQNLRLCIYG